MNPASLFKLKGLWEKFTARHPKFPAFIQAAGNGMMNDGTIVDITITAPAAASVRMSNCVKRILNFSAS